MQIANPENAAKGEAGLHANNPDLGPIQLNWDGAQRLALEGMAEQLKTEFFPMVLRWCEDHADRIETCVVDLSPSVVMVFVVTKNQKYDFSLSDSLADLEMELAKKSWPAEVLQIPDGSTESLQTFFDPEKAILVYGKSG